ncbi:TIGR02757 family protein [Robertkochia flava]|uniref:TIGR02757 family protein n=1 Tax=Robertkochia flava TaxID=3447986 RepID=UPI001CCB2236|nr:TIGR02757 family protein [Robertkochia marina]
MLTHNELKAFLDEKATQYNNPEFIDTDPVQIVHRYRQKEDMEIAGFLTATIAWGNRKSIINNANRMMELLGNSPFDFVMSHRETDLERLSPFVHRTYNGDDFKHFIKGLRHIYNEYGGIESVFSEYRNAPRLQEAIADFRGRFFEIPHLQRTEKHVSNPLKGSSAKRINMFLRWMVRQDNKGVDLGLWKQVSPAQLSCPLDVHSGKAARKLGLLKRKQNDAKALIELDDSLRKLDAQDPVRYDFALFGLGVFEKF